MKVNLYCCNIVKSTVERMVNSLGYVGVRYDEGAVQVPVVFAGLGQEALPYLQQSNTHWLKNLWTVLLYMIDFFLLKNNEVLKL